VSSQLSAPAVLTPRKDPGTYWIGGWEGPRVDPDVIPSLESNLGRPVRSLVNIVTELTWVPFMLL